jgi:hypothetical protein
MKRTASRRETDHKQPKHEEINNTSVKETIVNNPVSQERLAFIQQKQKELEEVEKLTEQSGQMVDFFKKILDVTRIEADSAKRVGDSLENWERVFIMMGDMNKGDANENAVWVRLKEDAQNYQKQ